jgi:hypothetical protein
VHQRRLAPAADAGQGKTGTPSLSCCFSHITKKRKALMKQVFMRAAFFRIAEGAPPASLKDREKNRWGKPHLARRCSGEFELVFEETTQPWRFQVEAEGYHPFVSDPVPSDFPGSVLVSLVRATDAVTRKVGEERLRNTN